MELQDKATEIVNFCAQWNICKLLSEKELGELEQAVIFRRYNRNTVVYAEGDKPEYLMCVVDGKVKIHKKGSGGRNQIVRMIKPSEMFGYRAFFAGERYVTEAVACESTTICLVPSDVVQRLIHQNAELACYFVKLLAIDLGEADVHTVSLTQKHIRGRLADALLFLKQKYGYAADGKTLNVTLSREELACLSNMTTSNAIRTLSQFSSEQLLTLQGRKIKIENELLLKKVALLS